MFNLLLSDPIAFVISALGLIIAITIHEFSHAWTADRLGDPTPRVQGRLTLNPLAHLDPIGTLSLLLIGFGWGRPVEFDPYNLRNKTRDSAIIAIAGPVSNIVLAIIISVVLHVVPVAEGPIYQSLIMLLFINVSLAIFNLVPVSPLDGEKILYALLPKLTAIEYRMFMRKYGLLVLLFLLLPIFGGRSPVSQLITPVINLIISVLLAGR